MTGHSPCVCNVLGGCGRTIFCIFVTLTQFLTALISCASEFWSKPYLLATELLSRQLSKRACAYLIMSFNPTHSLTKKGTQQLLRSVHALPCGAGAWSLACSPAPDLHLSFLLESLVSGLPLVLAISKDLCSPQTEQPARPALPCSQQALWDHKSFNKRVHLVALGGRFCFNKFVLSERKCCCAPGGVTGAAPSQNTESRLCLYPVQNEPGDAVCSWVLHEASQRVSLCFASD